MPIQTIPGALDAGVLFLCDHASNALPSDYGKLGLSEAHFQRHIAYDIGAEAMTRQLAGRFAAPAVMTCFSRLLIDPNRGADDPTLVMRLSDGALIPGNARIDAAEVDKRRRQFWQPYRDATRAMIDEMVAKGPIPAVVSMHSFTPVWKGSPRPWDVAVLWDNDPRIAKHLILALRKAGLVVGDNEPYDGALEGDTLFEHGTARGLAHVLIEVRQDLVGAPEDAKAWGDRLADVLEPILRLPEVHQIEHFPSRVHLRKSAKTK